MKKRIYKTNQKTFNCIFFTTLSHRFVICIASKYLFSVLVKTYLVTKLFKQDYVAQFNVHIPNK